MGSGRCLWDDLRRVNLKGWGVIAVNGTALYYKGKIDHACSLHPEEPTIWTSLRKAYFCESCTILTHAHAALGKQFSPSYEEADYSWQIEDANSGTSGLFGVMLALALGYDRIILAGIPMDDQGHFYDPPWLTDGCFKSDFVRSEWRRISQIYFDGRVKSLSGWTKDLLGEPDDTWLHS
jgi:hypothetical protein